MMNYYQEYTKVLIILHPYQYLVNSSIVFLILVILIEKYNVI